MNRGFTLVELLVVLVILGLLSLVAYPSVIKIVDDARDDSKKNQEKLILKAASEWAVEHPTELPNFFEADDACTCNEITKNVQDLLRDGYLTGEEVHNFDGYVEIKCNCSGSCNTCKYEYLYCDN